MPLSSFLCFRPSCPFSLFGCIDHLNVHCLSLVSRIYCFRVFFLFIQALVDATRGEQNVGFARFWTGNCISPVSEFRETVTVGKPYQSGFFNPLVFDLSIFCSHFPILENPALEFNLVALSSAFLEECLCFVLGAFDAHSCAQIWVWLGLCPKFSFPQIREFFCADQDFFLHKFFCLISSKSRWF